MPYPRHNTLMVISAGNEEAACNQWKEQLREDLHTGRRRVQDSSEGVARSIAAEQEKKEET